MSVLLEGGLLWTGFKAFVIALILTPILRDIFRSFNVVDRPGLRKIHPYPIPRIGGIPIALAYGLSLGAFGEGGLTLSAYAPPVVKLILAASVVFVTGLLDDFFTLRPWMKLTGQVAAALFAYGNGLRIETIAGTQLAPWLSLLLTVFWILLATNALNLIDGLDGLCAGIGLLATLTLFAAALLHNNTPLAYATFPLVGALLGFLCYNFNPATVFLGDSGAMLIGFLLGCYGMIWTQKTATLLSLTVPLLAISIPLLDVSLSVLRRFLQNRPIFGADKGHIHHRLLDRGLTPRRAVLVLYLVATVTAVFALLLSSPHVAGFRNLLILALLAVAWLGIRQLRYRELHIAGRLLFGGEFQKTLGARLRLENLRASLGSARTADDWWEVLTGLARENRWLRLTWNERTITLSPGEIAWSFEIALGEGGTVRVEGSGPSAVDTDLTAIAGIIRDTVPAIEAEGGPLALR